MKPIWIVDDDHSIRFVLERALQREGLPTRSFTHASEVLAGLRSALPEEQPQVLISDIRMPGDSGLQLLARLKEQHDDLPVIIMTAYSDLDSAVAAFQGGAFEYLAKPFDVTAAVALVKRAMQERRSEAVVPKAGETVPEILGQAPVMQEVFRAIGRLSQSHVTVLITGESGSGKELVARALHKHSPRARGEFVAINTAAIPKDLLESELFGHERGAFTGAQNTRRGRFEQAEGGTLFLDEIGDMPFDLQTRLLRVLSDGQYYRVGGHQAIRADVRVIAATHQDLEARVKAGQFREDLFHRLNVIRLRLPSLRERLDDLPVLVQHFLAVSAKQLGVEPKRISAAALARMQQYHYPGNVRQLENICHWLTVMAPAQVVDVADLPPEFTAPAAAAAAQASLDNTPLASDLHAPHAWDAAPSVAIGSGGQVLRSDDQDWAWRAQQDAVARLGRGEPNVWETMTQALESQLILAALAATGGRRVEAAQKLGIGRNTITRKIQELGLDA